MALATLRLVKQAVGAVDEEGAVADGQKAHAISCAEHEEDDARGHCQSLREEQEQEAGEQPDGLGEGEVEERGEGEDDAEEGGASQPKWVTGKLTKASVNATELTRS